MQSRIGELERQPQERVPTGDHPEHNPPDLHRIQEGPALETAARGVRRRISKKRAAKADRPWEAPLDPDGLDNVQWPGDMDEAESGPPPEPGAVEETARDPVEEVVDLHSDDEVEMHTRGESGTIVA